MKFTIYLVFYVLFGFVPQAAGSAICLYSLNRQSLFSKSFWVTTIIYSLISTSIRLAYDYGVIDFGFHTIIIWMIFIVIAIFYNKFPVIQSTVSILVSGLFIAIAELITAIVFVIAWGTEFFNNVMNNTQTIDDKILKAACGIPGNFLFVILAFVFYVVAKKRYERKQLESANEGKEQNT